MNEHLILVALEQLVSSGEALRMAGKPNGFFPVPRLRDVRCWWQH